MRPGSWGRWSGGFRACSRGEAPNRRATNAREGWTVKLSLGSGHERHGVRLQRRSGGLSRARAHQHGGDPRLPVLTGRVLLWLHRVARIAPEHPGRDQCRALQRTAGRARAGRGRDHPRAAECGGVGRVPGRDRHRSRGGEHAGARPCRAGVPDARPGPVRRGAGRDGLAGCGPFGRGPGGVHRGVSVDAGRVREPAAGRRGVDPFAAEHGPVAVGDAERRVRPRVGR